MLIYIKHNKERIIDGNKVSEEGRGLEKTHLVELSSTH